MSAIEGEIYQVKLQSSQDPLNFPIKLNNKIAALQGVIESADVRPTEQAYSVFRTLSNGLDEQLGKLDTSVKGKMPPVNQLLQRLKLDPIKAEALKIERPRRRLRPSLIRGFMQVGQRPRAELTHRVNAHASPAFPAVTPVRNTPGAQAMDCPACVPGVFRDALPPKAERDAFSSVISVSLWPVERARAR